MTTLEHSEGSGDDDVTAGFRTSRGVPNHDALGRVVDLQHLGTQPDTDTVGQDGDQTGKPPAGRSPK